MVALTCDLHVFASRFATRLSAVFFPIFYSAKTRDVCAHFRLLIRHYDCVLSIQIHLLLLRKNFDP